MGLILLKNALSLFEAPGGGGGGQPDQAQFGPAEELPADAFARLEVERGGQGQRDIHK